MSVFRAGIATLSGNSFEGVSTITQQLVKVLLNHEQERTFFNKLQESFFAVSLELFRSKEDILKMYINSIYLGNQAQGFNQASQLYFGTSIANLNEEDTLRLVATIGNPSLNHPWSSNNQARTELLANIFDVQISTTSPALLNQNSFSQIGSFELDTLGVKCRKSCQTTLDIELTETLREELRQSVERFAPLNVTHGAVVVIHIPSNSLLAIVGSPDPYRDKAGNQINMALEARPVGSTIKPFIYTKGFEQGLRPYSKVNDREYKYPIINGFPIYPKNYDGSYQGDVTLHYALSNSLNVPTVKVLEYVGLNSFYDFLLTDFSFEPIVDIRTYAYGIALGGLEMDLLTLTHFFSVFPNSGVLNPITVGSATLLKAPQADIQVPNNVFAPEHVALTTKILSDRDTGADQFGLKSNLHVPYHSYAVKTGTSRDFHDSWTVGYTPDFVVGVWIGNAENKPLVRLSGESGAGFLWKRAMDIVLNSKYESGNKFDLTSIHTFSKDNTLQYGLADDDISYRENLLTDLALIRKPHDGDVFLFEENSVVQLVANTSVEWNINGSNIGTAPELSWRPDKPGTYAITALQNSEKKETVLVSFQESESEFITD
jgi:membrane carboxypeptidase/penicillin-binding protein PbpC